MDINRRKAIATLGSAAFLTAAGQSHAQSGSQPPIRLVIPNGPGTPNDAAARAALPHIQESLRRIVVLDYKAGATGNIAAAHVAKAPADGNTLLMGTIATNAINYHVYPKMQFDPEKDFTAITRLTEVLMGIAVHPSVPARSIPELLALAKKSSVPLRYGSAGVGSPHHLAGALLARMGGVEMNHVPYQSTAKSILDLVGGNIEVGVVTLSAALPLHKEGRIRVIGMTEGRRNHLLPDVATVAETLRGFEFSVWTGLFGPAGLPPEVVQATVRAVHGAFSRPEVRSVLDAQGMAVSLTSSDEFTRYVAEEQRRWGRFVKDMNIKLE